MIAAEPEEKIPDNNQNSIQKQPLGARIQIYLIAAITQAANFLARTFTGLYSVFIGSSTTAISLITSLRNLIQQGLQSTIGRISDKFGRKLFMFIGLVISGISIALFPFIRNEWVLVGGVVALSIGFAIYSPAFIALQGDATNQKNRAGLISLLTIIGAFGSVIVLLATGFLGDLGGEEQTEFLIILEITAGLFIIAGLISIFLFEPPTAKLKQSSTFSFRPVKENPTFRRFVITNSIVSFCMSIGWPIFPIVRKNYASNIENTWLWAIFAFFQIVILLAASKIINKINRKWLLFIGRILMFYVPINLAVTIYWNLSWIHMAINSAVSGACNAFYIVGQNSYMLDCAPEAEKGTYTGIHNFFIGISTFIGSLAMGLIADNIMIVDEWFTIIVLLIIVAFGRFFSAFSFLTLKEPRVGKILELNEDDEVAN